MLAISTPLERNFQVTAQFGLQQAAARIQASVTEDNISLVSATLSWNDGSLPIEYGPAPSITIDEAKTLALGTYYVSIQATNYTVPFPEKVSAYFTVQVLPSRIVPETQEYLFGPVLPLDDKFSNYLQWNFNVGSNLDILKSSVKMLLITAKGERIMLPGYGTLLRQLLFDPNTDSLGGLIQKEITDAISQWEPRVKLDTFNLRKLSQQEVAVTANFISDLNQSSFTLTIPFSVR
jgi:phage baseplate assembly protein W